MRQRGVGGIIGSVVLAALLAGCGHGAPQASRKPPSTTSPTTATGTGGSRTGGKRGSTTSTTAVDAADTATSLPVVSCPTTFAITTPPPTVPLAGSATVEVPDTLASTLSVYSDSSGLMRLLAPSGWSCSASYGADGSGLITVTPNGETLPADGLEPGSPDRAITASETGGSPVQAAAEACSFFPAAATANMTYLGKACTPRPSSEIVDPISTSVVDFEDPTGIEGSGDPSGGQDPANGVVTYSPTKGPGFYMGTCTLPHKEHATCTAVLNYFDTLYGQG
jgi:hypothetical protein